MLNNTLSASEEAQLIAAANDLRQGGQLKNLDPLLGDQACHVRAFALVDLIRKISDLDNPLEKLSTKEKKFLIHCRMMAAVRVLPAVDKFGFLVRNEKTERGNLPVPGSTTQKVKVAAEYRASCSQFAFEATTSLVNPAIAALLLQNQKKLFREDPKESVKVIPFFLTLLGALESETTKQSPILLTISKINPSDDCAKIDTVDKITILLTPVNNELKVASSAKAKTFCRKPAIHIFLNAVDLEKLSKENFVKKYFSENVIDLLLATSIFHDQYPRLADGENPTIELGSYAEKFKSTRAFGESKKFVEDSRLYDYKTGELRTELLKSGMPPQVEHIIASIISNDIIKELTTLSNEEVCKNIAI